MKHVHTRIEDPLELRKDILEAALDATEAMKSVEIVAQLKDDTTIFTQQFKNMSRDLQKAFKDFEKSFPTIPQELHETQQQEQPKKQVVQPRPTSLDSDLNELREKIRQLKFIKNPTRNL